MRVGIDLVNIPELEERLKDIPLETIFSADELSENVRAENLAGVFACKEAFFKAIGKKIDWRDVWITKKPSGEPELSSAHLAGHMCTVSVSHSGDYAIAIVVLFDQNLIT